MEKSQIVFNFQKPRAFWVRSKRFSTITHDASVLAKARRIFARYNRRFSRRRNRQKRRGIASQNCIPIQFGLRAQNQNSNNLRSSYTRRPIWRRDMQSTPFSPSRIYLSYSSASICASSSTKREQAAFNSLDALLQKTTDAESAFG